MPPRAAARRVHLNRALSKLGLLTRSQANAAILDGRVFVDGRVITDPATPVVLDGTRIKVKGRAAEASPWRMLLVHKPKGVVTTRQDPEGRPTIYDVVGDAAYGLIPVGRLDMASTGLLLMTTDTELAAFVTDPVNRIGRTYVVTVRGEVQQADIDALHAGITDRGQRLRADAVTLRKSAGRESHLIVELTEGKNREVRRLMKSIGHEVTRLKRVAFGGLELGDLKPGAWRDVDATEVTRAFPRAAVQTPGSSRRV